MVAKKTAAATKSAPKEAPAHPPYGQMILAAITELKGKKGSSRMAIIKYIKENYSVGDNVNLQVRRNLIRMSEKNEIAHAKDNMHGASGSFKLPAKSGTTPKKAAKKTASSPKKEDSSPVKAKSSPKKAASPKKTKTSPKKPTAKKASKK